MIGYNLYNCFHTGSLQQIAIFNKIIQFDIFTLWKTTK